MNQALRESHLTKRVTLNDTVYAGTLIEEGKIFVKVRNLQDESRIAKIIDMIDTNESLKASIQSKAEHMADAIVPYSFLGFFGVLGIYKKSHKSYCSFIGGLFLRDSFININFSDFSNARSLNA